MSGGKRSNARDSGHARRGSLADAYETPALLRMGELRPEQAPWVLHPLFAWGAIETKAGAGLGHMNIPYEPHHVSGSQLAEFMDDVLGAWCWRDAPAHGLIHHNQLEALRHEIERGRWVVLRSSRFTMGNGLVDWVDDPALPDGGRWQVNLEGERSQIGGALRWQLDAVYRRRQAMARTTPLSGEPFRAQFDEPLPGVQVAGPGAGPKPAALTKAQRWRERKALIAAGRGNPVAHVKAAVERLARNNVAVEKARLSNHVYDPTKPVPEGWGNASGDVHILRRYGLKEEDFEIKGTKFRAQLYEPDPSVFGNDMKPTLAFKGTEMSSLKDWSNNATQGLNMESPYYKQAVRIGKKLKGDIFPIDVAGHSQGGGLCAAASRVSGKECWSFNAAGLHPKTVERYGGASQPSEIHAYHVKGEILTTLQSSRSLPEAVGTPYALEGKGSSVGRHFISQVIDGIEQQKQEDISILQEVSP